MFLRSPTNPCITCVLTSVCLFLPGVSKAVEHVNKTIAPALISKVGAICLLLTSPTARQCPEHPLGECDLGVCAGVHVNKLTTAMVLLNLLNECISNT